MDTNLHLELLTLAVSKLHSRSRSLIHRLGNVNQPFLYTKFPQGPPQNRPRHSIERLLQVNKSHPEIFLLLNKLLLHLSYNKYCINGTSPPVKPNCISSTFTCPLNLTSITLSKTFITWSSNFTPLSDPHSKASPFPLNTVTNQLFLQSAGITPSFTITLHRSVTQITPASPAADSISAPIPDGPTAFPAFNLPIAALTSLAVISAAGPLTACRVSRPSLSQSNSSFKSFSKCLLHTSFNPSRSTTTFPSSSLIQPSPTTSLFFATICLTTLNTFPFPSASSSFSTSLILSAS